MPDTPKGILYLQIRQLQLDIKIITNYYNWMTFTFSNSRDNRTKIVILFKWKHQLAPNGWVSNQQVQSWKKVTNFPFQLLNHPWHTWMNRKLRVKTLKSNCPWNCTKYVPCCVIRHIQQRESITFSTWNKRFRRLIIDKTVNFTLICKKFTWRTQLKLDKRAYVINKHHQGTQGAHRYDREEKSLLYAVYLDTLTTNVLKK